MITDFGTFKAPSNATVFGTAVQSSPFSLAGGKAAFGGIRNGSGGISIADEDDDEEEEVGNGKQKVELRESSISFDQVSDFSQRQ